MLNKLLSVFNPTITREYYYYTAIIALVVAVFCVAFVIKQKITWYQAVVIVAIVVYIFLVFSSTVFCRIKTSGKTYDLKLFWSYKVVVDNWVVSRYYAQAMLKQIVLNFLLLVPVGFLVPVVIKNCSGVWSRAALATIFCMFISIAIEVMQLVFQKGLCELDDVLGNTFGALAASLLCSELIELINRMRRK